MRFFFSLLEPVELIAGNFSMCRLLGRVLQNMREGSRSGEQVKQLLTMQESILGQCLCDVLWGNGNYFEDSDE